MVDEYMFIKDLATLIISVITLSFAWRGLSTWKEQAKGLKSYEVVQNIHLALLGVREAIGYVRKNWISIKESRKAMEFAQSKYPDRSEVDIQKRLEEHVYEMRWEKIDEAFSNLERHLLGAEVLWGSDITALTRPFYNKVVDLNAALESKFSDDPWMGSEEMRKVIYDGSGWEKDDEFKKEVNIAIQKVVEYMKDKIS